MKKITLVFLLIFLVNIIFGQSVLNPTIISQDEYSLTIDKIELSYNSTILYCTHTAPDTYENGGWVRIEPGIILKETYGNRKYKLVKAEGVPLSPNKHNYSYEGQKLTFRLIFQKVANDISFIDLIECIDNRSCFNFYGIKIKESTYSNSTPTYERTGRKFLRDQISQWGECKNVAMTMTGGDVALYKKNGWAAQGAPKSMTEKFNELNEADRLIDDVVLTEEGNWLILWGNNGISSFGTPDGLYSKLKKWNQEKEVITSVTFNDLGDWIAITKKKYSASSEKIMKYIQEGENEYGEFWAAHLTNDGLVLCYERGYKYMGNVPENLKLKLKETKINVFRIKFLSDGSFFIADFKGNYDYNM
jgi:hypothetical protein